MIWGKVSGRMRVSRSSARTSAKQSSPRCAVASSRRSKRRRASAAQASASRTSTATRSRPSTIPQVNALRNSYQSAFSHYLAGFVYEALGEPSLAAAGYRQAIELHPNVPALEQALAGLDLRVAAPDDGKTDVLFEIETGLVPARVSRQFSLPIPINGRWVLVSASFPVLRSQDVGANPLRASHRRHHAAGAGADHQRRRDGAQGAAGRDAGHPAAHVHPFHRQGDRTVPGGARRVEAPQQRRRHGRRHARPHGGRTGVGLGGDRVCRRALLAQPPGDHLRSLAPGCRAEITGSSSRPRPG